MRTRFHGADQISRRLRQIANRFPREVGHAMLQETEIEATEVRKRTPVDTGALRSSEHVEGPTYEGSRISTAIVAGGPSAPYALQVHEDLEAFHPVGQAKYIESVLKESAPYMGERIGRRLNIEKL